MKITEKQRRVLDFIEQFIAEQGLPPSRAEIAAGLGFRSLNAVQDHLRVLARKGALELQEGLSRGIRLAAPLARGLPLVGRVAAGSPILAEECIEDHFQVDPRLFRPRADYLLKVQGMSMRDAGILNGDLLAVHRQAEARSGDIVVARLDDEVTVKRFRRRGRQVRLLPENPDYAPILVDLRHQELAIEGIGVGVIRNRRLAGGN